MRVGRQGGGKGEFRVTVLEQFRVVFEAIRELMTQEEIPPSRRIGFATHETETDKRK